MASIVKHVKDFAEGLVGLTIVASAIRCGWQQCLLKFNGINGHQSADQAEATAAAWSSRRLRI